jgi:hypothetical protein
MNFSELRAILSPVVGSTLAVVSTETKPYIPPHPKGSIVKRQQLRVAIFFGAAYGMLTGTEPGPRKWGTRLNDTPFIMHKGEAYLECFLVSEERTDYLLHGAHVPESMLRIREREELVKLRCFKLENIQSINLV